MYHKVGLLFPHPPIIIDEIGKNYLKRVENTLGGIDNALNDIKDISFDTILIVSPHAPAGIESINVYSQKVLSGDFSHFGISGFSLKAYSDEEFLNKLFSFNGKIKFEAIKDKPLDHGVLVPLYFLQKKGIKGKIVASGICWNDSEYSKEIGRVIDSIAKELGRNILFLASGDLSHCLTHSAPAGYDIRGKVFDKYISDFFSTGNKNILLEMDKDILEHAAECGFRPLLAVLGFFTGEQINTKLYSYEGPFGVGYLVGSISVSQNASFS